jgi:hypothetical protein
MNNFRYKEERVVFPVKYVIRCSVGRKIWPDISAYIVESGLTAVMYVKRNSVRKLI